MNTPASRRNAVVKMVRALHIKPHTVAELSVISGLDETTVNAWLKALRADPHFRLVMIGDWRPDALGRCVIPAYAWGLCGQDMAKPAPLTRSQITARYRANKKGASA